MLIGILVFVVFAFNVNAETFTRKARVPQPQEFTYESSEYTYNVVDNQLSGINTFSIVYNVSPPAGKLYQYINQTMKTGKETVKIVVGQDNTKTYTYSNTVVHWYYDKVQLRWIKRFNDKLYGTYTFKVNKEGIVTGIFTIPVNLYSNSNDLTLVNFVKGNGRNDGIAAKGTAVTMGRKNASGVYQPYNNIEWQKSIGVKTDEFCNCQTESIYDAIVEQIPNWYNFKNIITSKQTGEPGEGYTFYTNVRIMFPATTKYLSIHEGPFANTANADEIFTVTLPNILLDYSE